ncbi:MAG: histidinol-phosphatase [Lachnospiraceae bacterium]|nr:histidinol-phosphatase [Lachnospiraceae bacterium]
MINLLKDYPYLYETHLHTSQVSRCARCTGAEMARAAKEAGYTGIFVTDHHWGGNTAVDKFLPWDEWAEAFAAGYRDAKQCGDEIGLDVFFGWEAGFRGTEFLIYGLSPEWMKEHPELRSPVDEIDDPDFNMTPEKQYPLIHEAGGMVIHAHPFREEFYIPEIRLYPEYVDGVEGINATHSNPKSQSHNDPEYDTKAIAYAHEHSLPLTAGSDIHSTDLFDGGVAFKRRLTSGRDYCDAILGGEDYVLTNGVQWFDKKGKPLS